MSTFVKEITSHEETKGEKQTAGGSGKSNKKASAKKKEKLTKAQALQALQHFNKQVFKIIEFDLTKLVGLINDMLRTRDAYIFNSVKDHDQL